MNISKTWAVEITRIEQFFVSQGGVPVCDSPGGTSKQLQCGSCIVTLTPLAPRPLGPVKVPRTLVEITGEENEVNQLYDRFFFRFISAGG